MTEITWPSYTNDSGTLQDGTEIDSDFLDSIESGINALVHSSSNPGITPADAIDELVAARGNEADLDARISGVIDDDGALITPASLVSQSQLQAQVGSAINLCMNSTFFLWSGGKTVNPDYWTRANGSITIAGTGESDTERKIGKYCAKFTWSSGTATLSQNIVHTSDFGNLDYLKTEEKKVGFGCWVKTSIASHVRLRIDDGNSTTDTSYHTGSGNWEWLSGVHTMSAAATKLHLVMRNEQAGSCYFSGAVVCFSDFAPARWFPEPKIRGSAFLELPGTLSTSANAKFLHFARPVRLDRIQASIVTGPTGADIQVSFDKAGTGWEEVVAQTTLIAAGDQLGGITIDPSDYSLRCINGFHNSSGGGSSNNARLSVDQVGSSVAGADMFVRVDGVQCIHPFEDHIAFNREG